MLGKMDGFHHIHVERPFDKYTRQLTDEALSEFILGMKKYCDHKGYEMEVV